MNSYYSNKIEGQHTLPLEIEQALRNDYAQDADKARRQRMALAHMATEAQLEALWPTWDDAKVWSVQTVCDIHQDLFARLPETDLAIESPAGLQNLQPGALREREVSVGRHAAPAAAVLPAFLSRCTSFYSGVRRGELQLVAMAAAHQRLAWIHPFADGNGRVVRLHSHLVLGHMGLTNGLWTSDAVTGRSSSLRRVWGIRLSRAWTVARPLPPWRERDKLNRSSWTTTSWTWNTVGSVATRSRFWKRWSICRTIWI
jgi:Fic family protein